MEQVKAKPFLKWAGGKGQLISQLRNYYPVELQNGGIEKYFEPFIGGGAIFFDLLQNFKVKSAYISDVNKDLILVYKVIQQKSDDLLDLLEKIKTDYLKLEENERSEMFYQVRQEFNEGKNDIDYCAPDEKWTIHAARTIFLNKTCFNGLFRLNSKGHFNVPFGRYKNPVIYDEQNLKAVSQVLENVEIKISNYSECFNQITENSFVYFDPPYRPISRTSDFTTYTGSGFGDKEQLELAAYFRKIDIEKKAKVMLSNSDPKNENQSDDFFERAYSGYNIQKVDASRAINSNGARRGKIKELVITNY